MTSRREDIRDIVIKICCKGTTLRSINTIKSYMTLLVVVLDNINHYNITTTYYWGWVMKGYQVLLVRIRLSRDGWYHLIH